MEIFQIIFIQFKYINTMCEYRINKITAKQR